MTRKFQPTEKQIALWSNLKPESMPSDDEFKANWKRGHHGKVTGWGMDKRQWVINHADDHLTKTMEYMLGVWEGRIDALNGDEPMETPEYHTDPFQYGYHGGYNGFVDFWKGYDQAAREKFSAQYKK